MKLSQDILYYRLSKQYPVFYVGGSYGALCVKRPVFFDGSNKIDNCTVIITAAELISLIEMRAACTGSLFICIGQIPETTCIPACSIIVIDTEVSLAVIFNELQDIYNLFDAWDENMKTVCYEGGGFSELIDSCDPIIYDPISVVDKSFHFICYSKELSKERGLIDMYVTADFSVPMDIVNGFVANPEFPELFKRRDVFVFSPESGDVMCKNLFFRDEYVGRIGLSPNSRDEHLLKYNEAIVTHLYYYTDKLYCKYMSFNAKEICLNSIRSLLLDCLNKKEVSNELWEKAFDENGWKRKDQLQIIQFRPNPRYDKNIYANYLASEIERKWHGCACFEHNDRLFLLVNRDQFGTQENMNFIQSLAYFLRDSLLVAGLSRPFNAMRYLCSAYEQTEVALDFGVRYTPTLWYFKFDDYALSYMLSKCVGPYEPEQICSEKLLALKRHDAERNTEYYKTLFVYFQCKFNAAAAAKKLFIHRSSFLSRMERMREVADIDFESYNELIYLVVSFELLKEQEKANTQT